MTSSFETLKVKNYKQEFRTFVYKRDMKKSMNNERWVSILTETFTYQMP